jgi:MFS family permease
VLAIVLAGYPLVLIDVSILMAAPPSIRADLGFSDTSLSWAQTAYTLTFGGLSPSSTPRAPTATDRRSCWPIASRPR